MTDFLTVTEQTKSVQKKEFQIHFYDKCFDIKLLFSMKAMAFITNMPNHGISIKKRSTTISS